MRMRKLGKGQSVVFCVPREIEAKIEALMPPGCSDPIGVHNILRWAIRNTGEELMRGKHLWENQQRRHEKHQLLWREKAQSGKSLQPALAEKFLEPECRTLMETYRPVAVREDEVSQVAEDEAGMDEEQERELAPEIEAEQEKEGPPPATAARHTDDEDVEVFIKDGVIRDIANGYGLAFPSLRHTRSAALFAIAAPLGKTSSLFATADFAQTIVLEGGSRNSQDAFLRPVQWVLSSLSDGPERPSALMIISPFEVNLFWQKIAESERVTLHLYAPHINMAYPSLDTLDLFTIPPRPTQNIPPALITELLLFSGQLYVKDYTKYIEVCEFLGLAWKHAEGSQMVGPDGFLLQDAMGPAGGRSGFVESPVKFVQSLMALRRDGQSINKTHVGDMLDNKLLLPRDFEEGDDSSAMDLDENGGGEVQELGTSKRKRETAGTEENGLVDSLVDRSVKRIKGAAAVGGRDDGSMIEEVAGKGCR